MENVRKHRGIKLVARERKINYLAFSRTNLSYYKAFHIKSVSNRMRKTQILMNKPAYLGLSISDLSKNVMYAIWYDYVKPKCCKNEQLCYMDTDSFIVYVKADNIWKDIEQEVETRFDTSSFKLDRPLPKPKKKNVVRIMNAESGGKLMKELIGLRAKIYSYLKTTMRKIIKKRKGKRVS